MSNQHIQTLFKILNIWFAYIFILIISYYLPHWENLTFLSWINEAVYFLLFIITFNIVLKDNINKDVFIILALYLFVASLSFINIFLGENYILGTNKFSFNIYIFKSILMCAIFNLFIIYITVKQSLSANSVFKNIFITGIFILPASLYGFRDFIFSMNSMQNSEVIPILYKSAFIVDILGFLSIIWYFIQVYRNDSKLGEFINGLMAIFFIFLAFNILDNLSVIFNFKIFRIGQYFLTANLIIMSHILIKKLIFLNSDFGQFYEHAIKNPAQFGKVKIIRRNSAANHAVMNVLGAYFYIRRNYIMFMALLISCAIIYFESPDFLTLNILTIIASSILLFVFYIALYKKRQKHNYYL